MKECTALIKSHAITAISMSRIHTNGMIVKCKVVEKVLNKPLQQEQAPNRIAIDT
jgi:hypothetical protein